MSHYDFILFENYHQAQNHKYDMVLTARMLAHEGLNVAIFDIYGEDDVEDIEGIPVLHLPFSMPIPDDRWQIAPKNKLHSLACKIRYYVQQHIYIREVVRHIEPLADNFYCGSYHVLMSTRLMTMGKPTYFWGLRSDAMKFRADKFVGDPLEEIHSLRLKHAFVRNSACRLFVSNGIILNEFNALGIDRDRLVIREERCVEKIGDANLSAMDGNISFLVIGMLRKEKNVPLTVEAFRLADIPLAKLRLVGKSRDRYEGCILSAMGADSRIERRNEFLDYKDFNAYFAQSHFVLFADDKGPSCITNGTMMEALINFRPVICPDYNPYSYYIKKYNVGILYTPGDVKSYAAAISKAVALGAEHFVPDIRKFLETIEFGKVSRQLAKDVREGLNVVFVDPNTFPVGGAMTKRHRYLVDYLNAQGMESEVLVCDFKKRSSLSNPMEGRYGACVYKDITPIADSGRYLKFWREGKQFLKQSYKRGRKNIAVFDTMLVWSSYPFYRYAKKLGYTVVFDQVETSMLQNGKVSRLRYLNMKFGEMLSDMAFRCNPGIVISTALMEENRRLYPGRKLCLLQNATPVFCTEPKAALGNPLTLMYSGTYSAKDGVRYLIEAVIKAHERGCDCRLVLLGAGVPEDMKVLELAKGHEYIEYKGYVSDDELKRMLLGSDVLCMTRTNSRFARFGFPFKLSEYLSCGNVLLATDVGDVTLYVEDKVSAYVVEPENSDAIARVIEYIQTHEKEALTVARNGLECAQRHFSIDVVGRKFVEFLMKI